jgi:hypothetical protein
VTDERPWTPEEDGLLLTAHRSGLHVRAIAKRLGRETETVRRRLLVLLHAERRATGGCAHHWLIGDPPEYRARCLRCGAERPMPPVIVHDHASWSF